MMFEKEAEEYYYKKVFAETNPKNETELKEKFLQTFKDGAEFGYNKANEWHYIKNGDLPKKSISVLAYFEEDVSLVECLYISDEGFKHPVFSEWYEPTAWIEIEKILPKELEKC